MVSSTRTFSRGLSRRRPQRASAAVAALVAVSIGCAGAGATGKVEYSVSAKQNYDKGLARLKDEDWIAGAKYFSFIKARFPYSKYAVLAELRMADAEYGAGEHLQAIDSYQMFIKFHPTHEMVANGYAAFRIGSAYYQMLPTDFWLLPPSYEKDQSSTKDAHRELSKFGTKYPESPYIDKSRAMIAKCAKRLAQHEWYVARYYWEQGKPMGTVLRLRTLLDSYKGVGYDVEALWLLGRAYQRVDMPDRARKTWQQLVEEHPTSDRAQQAKSELAKLSG
jgi:outer membrane protein assembly factor BamD